MRLKEKMTYSEYHRYLSRHYPVFMSTAVFEDTDAPVVVMHKQIRRVEQCLGWDRRSNDEQLMNDSHDGREK